MKYFWLRVVIFLGCLELLLRLGGWISSTGTEIWNKKEVSGNEYRIMCVGESTTYEGGEDSFPRQLEKILNQLDSSCRYKVINKGLPGGSTEKILKGIESWLAEYHPQMVVAMMGINDPRAGVSEIEKLDEQNPLVKALLDIRVVKLFKGLGTDAWATMRAWSWKDFFVKKSFEQKKPAPSPDVPNKIKPEDMGRLSSALLLESQGRFADAEKIFLFLVTKYPGFDSGMWMVYRHLGDTVWKEKKYKEYIMVIQLLLEYNASDAWAVNATQRVCRERKDDPLIEKMLRAFIQKSPKVAPLHELLGSCYVERGETAKADAAFEQARKLFSANVNPLTRKNYQAIVAILKRNNVLPVFVQYPLRPVQELRELLLEIGVPSDAIVVDNEGIFQAAIAQTRYEDYFTDRFAGNFGHATASGNRLLAENIAKRILGRLDKR